MRLTARQSAAMKGTRMRELRALGYTSDVFALRWNGGTCGITGEPLLRGVRVAYFRDKGLCSALAINDLVDREKRSTLPKCGCGRPAADERQGCCLRCSDVAENWLDEMYEDVTRDGQPVSASTV